MVRLRDAVGGMLIFFPLIGILYIARNQILGQAIKTQTPDFLDFFVDIGTPELTGSDMINIGIGIFFIFIGIILVSSGRK